MEGNEESPDVIIDSYMEVTKSIPDVGVKLEVAEDNAQQLPFIPDSSAEAERQEREQQQHPTPPHFTPVMSGSGTSVDPVTVDGTKDLFDSGKGSVIEPISIEKDDTKSLVPGQVIDLEAVETLEVDYPPTYIQEEGVVEMSGYINEEVYQTYASLGTVPNEQVAMSEVEIGNMSHEVIEIAPTIVEEEPMVEIGTGTVSESGEITVQEPGSSAMSQQAASYITFGNNRQLSITPLQHIQQQGRSILINPKELNKIDKTINKGPSSRNKKSAPIKMFDEELGNNTIKEIRNNIIFYDRGKKTGNFYTACSRKKQGLKTKVPSKKKFKAQREFLKKLNAKQQESKSATQDSGNTTKKSAEPTSSSSGKRLSSRRSASFHGSYNEKAAIENAWKDDGADDMFEMEVEAEVNEKIIVSPDSEDGWGTAGADDDDDDDDEDGEKSSLPKLTEVKLESGVTAAGAHMKVEKVSFVDEYKEEKDDIYAEQVKSKSKGKKAKSVTSSKNSKASLKQEDGLGNKRKRGVKQKTTKKIKKAPVNEAVEDTDKIEALEVSDGGKDSDYVLENEEITEDDDANDEDYAISDEDQYLPKTKKGKTLPKKSSSRIKRETRKKENKRTRKKVVIKNEQDSADDEIEEENEYIESSSKRKSRRKASPRKVVSSEIYKEEASGGSDTENAEANDSAVENDDKNEVKKETKKRKLPFKARAAKKKWPCGECDEVLSSAVKLKRHHRVTHSGKKNWSCRKCNLVFEKRSEYSRHKQEEHGPEEEAREGKRWPCNRCEDIFESREDFKDHKEEKHRKDSLIKDTICPICNETCSILNGLHEHLFKRHGIDEYMCGGNVCDAKFVSRARLRNHRKKCEKYAAYVGKSPCAHCGKMFLEGGLTAHIRAVHMDRKFPCLGCKQLLNSGEEFNAHKRTCIQYKKYRRDQKRSTEGGVCAICGQTFTLTGSYLNHKQFYHNDPNIKCPFCPKMLKTKPALLYHICTHKEVEDWDFDGRDEKTVLEERRMMAPPPLPLTQQNHLYDSSSPPPANYNNHPSVNNGIMSPSGFNLYYHNSDQHPGGPPNKSEEQQQATDGTVDKNPEKQDGDDDNKFKCPMCEWTTITRECMKDHILCVHNMKSKYKGKIGEDSDERGKFNPADRPTYYNYQMKKFDSANYKPQKSVCEICGQSFAVKVGLEYHIARVHTKQVYKNCEICDRSFMARTAYLKHKRCVHGIYERACNQGKRPKTHKTCEVCGEKIHVSGFKKHADIHLGIFRFSCDVCQKKCRSKHDLIVHSRIHTGEKPYSCEECDRRFSDLANLRHHEQKIHKIRRIKPKPNYESISTKNMKEFNKHKQAVVSQMNTEVQAPQLPQPPQLPQHQPQDLQVQPQRQQQQQQPPPQHHHPQQPQHQPQQPAPPPPTPTPPLYQHPAHQQLHEQVLREQQQQHESQHQQQQQQQHHVLEQAQLHPQHPQLPQHHPLHALHPHQLPPHAHPAYAHFNLPAHLTPQHHEALNFSTLV